MSADWSGVDPDADPDLDPDSDCTGKYAFGDSLNERRGNEAMVTWLKAILIPILIFVVVVVKLALDGSWNEEQSTPPIGPFRQPINTPPSPASLPILPAIPAPFHPQIREKILPELLTASYGRNRRVIQHIRQGHHVRSIGISAAERIIRIPAQRIGSLWD